MFNNIYQNKKILITGHTGFKGSWLSAWLLKLGANITGVALTPNTSPSHFNLLNLPIESHFVDIRDYEKLKNVIKALKPEIVFHLAAQPLVRESYDDPLYTFETNVIGTANVLNACRDLDDLRGIVVVTSDKCYENKEWIWGYRESDAMGGFDPYSASKGSAELVTASFRNSYFNLNNFGKSHQTLIASARAGNVIGGGDWAKDRLITDIVCAIVKNEKVIIRNPNATRPWQYVLECLNGYLMLGEKLLSGEKAFAEGWNFAPLINTSVTVLEVLQKIQQHWPKLQYEIQSDARNPHEAHLLKLDSAKANNILGWRNVWDFSQTIEKTITWYKNFYENNVISTIEDIKLFENKWLTKNN